MKHETTIILLAFAVFHSIKMLAGEDAGDGSKQFPPAIILLVSASGKIT